MPHDVKDLDLAADGKKRIEWADNFMLVLKRIRKRFEKEKPLDGVTVGCCMHVTTETANLMRTLMAGGASVNLCASNPLSTQDDVAAALAAEYGGNAFAIRGEDNETYYDHIKSVAAAKPNLTMDDGCDLIAYIHSEAPELFETLWGSMEETTTGIIRLRAMERDNALKVPVIAVNDAKTKHFFDNRYGTGQSTVDGIIRATNVLMAGRNVVACGYGWCGRGFAMRASGMGARVIVTEVDAVKALEAAMDGYQVMPIAEAAKVGEVFCTLTGNKHVIRTEHFEAMRDGAIVANSGHFNIELDLEGLGKIAKEVKPGSRELITEYTLASGKRIFVLAEGRLVNLAAAEGHPASVMDMSFAVQALTAEYVVKNKGKLDVKVNNVPDEIDEFVSRIKLETMSIDIDTLTDEQARYLSSWQEGT
ncbi:MAG: adenosylhomocysteinase [Planctomycetota bacterium]|nr:MAG: adenosylhomocysteinase [Planctomycetota bacterium]